MNDNAAQKYAVDLVIAMQLTNIARDVLTDAKINRRYIPATWLNYQPEEIIYAFEAHDPLIYKSAEKLLSCAEEYYIRARRGYRYIPTRARFAIAVAARIYRGIGVKIQSHKHAYYRKRMVVSGLGKVGYSLSAMQDIFSSHYTSPDRLHDLKAGDTLIRGQHHE